jgi:hypothetical protein
MATQIYRSVYTGAEIDQAIADMQGALSAQLIVNDFSGGTGKIASAELAKILNNSIIANDQPTHIRSQLTSIPDSHVLTDAEYSKFNFLTSSSGFRGRFVNSSARDTALSTEYPGYTGKEISFIDDDGSGDNLSELSRWDVSSGSWKKVQLYNAGGSVPVTIAAAGANNFLSFRFARYNTMKAMVQVSTADGTQRQVQEAMLTYIHGDVYISVYSEVGNNSGLFSLSTAVDSTNVYLVVTTTQANLSVTGKVLAMI